ncbi:hypothetical protein INT46_007982 [Mucor plumbeus]|uniref:NmrA-like domain-containing protein n=1 Tax=Mucor plumbeus TaxID=97098 RepID=A0A8H7RLE4_9FUNG|nr:hypothetical protein INT46_007982 [Mucor plumbeus]
MSPVERVFIVGGTGNIGTKTVNDLLDNQIAITLFARNVKKVSTLFPNGGDLLNVLQGDLQDISPIKEGIKGHTRLLLLVHDFASFTAIKKTIATYAYDAGVKQIVDISSSAVNLGWRTSAIGAIHYSGEKAIFDIPNRGYFVALRPARFMSNMLRDRPIANDGIYTTAPIDFRQGYISPNDIGAVAAVVLREDVDKHADATYNLTGDIITPRQQTDITSRLIGKKVTYHQISAAEMYNNMMSTGWLAHPFVLDLVDHDGIENNLTITPSIEILLGRKPETAEEYLALNKDKIL